MINEQKILDYLQNDLKRPLVDIDDRHNIICKSPIVNLKAMIEFVEPLHYYVTYNCNSIYINPKH